MLIEAACIAGYYLLCDYLNPHNQKKRRKEQSIRSMKGDIMKEVERKLKGMSITAGGNVSININIQVNNYSYENCNKITFDESPLSFDFRHSELFTKKQENLFDNALKFSHEEIILESLKEKGLLPKLEMKIPFEKYKLFTHDLIMKDILGSKTKK